MSEITRRKFIQSTTASGVAAATLVSSSGQVQTSASAQAQPRASLPAIISSANGLKATQRAMGIIRAGGDTLDAVIAGVNIVEEDPEDTSVGYGGLPNADGEVELDASVMHGPSRRSGAVAALQHIKTPSKVAQLVLQRTDHILLVGPGALKFALMHGFQRENLLTEKARKRWVQWKESLSDKDDWLAPPQERKRTEIHRTWGTINCCAVDAKGDISGVTTTSGLAFKIPGRVGDSPIIGAGLYLDNDVGAAGSTGRGEANIKVCGAHTVVEGMRRGLSPEQACLEALKRVVDTTREDYLLDKDGRPDFQLNFYAINKKGQFGGAALWSGARFAAHNGVENKLYDSAYLFKRPAGYREPSE